MKAKEPRVIVISSVSGGGKNTVVRHLLESTSELRVAITATSRKPRSGEVDGKDYLFLDREVFQSKIENGEFLEHATVHGNLYGVPESSVRAILDSGKSAILIIDVQGRRHIKERLGQRVMSIFLMPPDKEQWEDRLRHRGTDSESDIRLRLQDGLHELEEANQFDYVVTNDSIENCSEKIKDLLRQEGAL
ncbi:MAG: guanylate kinase [Leptospiraceae bacterium]|nr:guanylate kinase [Leptospiraceae bacterium]MCB1304248.1 guanylate kinase [Leptospiraceae bacterium]